MRSDNAPTPPADPATSLDPAPADLIRFFEGAILGTAVGDAIGLPREGLSRRRAARLFGGPPLGYRFLFGRGMTSDDTEHTCMAAQALLASGGRPDVFARSLAWRLRGWLLGLPAGVGKATARAVFKLWLGFPLTRSGVWSAGNGPAMRAAVLGVWAWDDPSALRRLVAASTRLTHTDPAAEHGALAVAAAAAYAVRQSLAAVDGRAVIEPSGYLAAVGEFLDGMPLHGLIEEVVAAVSAGQTPEEYLAFKGLSRGVSGYVNHTVPAALFCWLRWPADFRTAVEQIVLAGGDADTTGAIVGALAGVSAGPPATPPEWVGGLAEWPRSVWWMRRLAATLARAAGTPGEAAKPLPLFWPGLVFRNLLFLLVVLLHGLRRLLPPW